MLALKIIRRLTLTLVAAILIITYSHGTVVVTDEEWEVCVAQGHCEFGIDRFYTE